MSFMIRIINKLINKMRRTQFFSLCLIITIFYACDSKSPEYNPTKGEPDLSLFTGDWQGVYSTVSFSGSISYRNELEMMGAKAGERDMLSMISLDDNGIPKADSYPDKLYVTADNVNFLSEDYITDKYIKTDSVNFEWNLSQETSFKDQNNRTYKDHLQFSRKTDSLFTIITRIYEDGDEVGENNKEVIYETSLIKK